jgi:hypothetical protein
MILTTPYPLIYHPLLSLIKHSARVLKVLYNLLIMYYNRFDNCRHNRVAIIYKIDQLIILYRNILIGYPVYPVYPLYPGYPVYLGSRPPGREKLLLRNYPPL